MRDRFAALFPAGAVRRELSRVLLRVARDCRIGPASRVLDAGAGGWARELVEKVGCKAESLGKAAPGKPPFAPASFDLVLVDLAGGEGSLAALAPLLFPGGHLAVSALVRAAGAERGAAPGPIEVNLQLSAAGLLPISVEIVPRALEGLIAEELDYAFFVARMPAESSAAGEEPFPVLGTA